MSAAPVRVRRALSFGGERPAVLALAVCACAAAGEAGEGGLWDMHVHSQQPHTELVYPLLIANGVTGMRDASSEVPLDSLLLWRREVLVGTRVGPPRQLFAGLGVNVRRSCEVCYYKGHACARDSAEAWRLVDSLKIAGVDFLFMSDMIRHHVQALLIARWIPTHGANDALRRLGERIVVGQTDEQALMTRWLQDRREPLPDTDASHVAMDYAISMPGMLTAEQLAALDRARGPAFDRLFLRCMIIHHQGAVRHPGRPASRNLPHAANARRPSPSGSAP